MLKLEKYSFGVGDRFAHQGKAQLKAIMQAQSKGVNFTPVWNKSNREHTTIHSEPMDVRYEADAAVKDLGYNGQYLVDADHINMSNVDGFIEASDFFTLDVADYIGKKAEQIDIEGFIDDNIRFIGELQIPGIKEAFTITKETIVTIAEKFLFAIKQAGELYRHIESKKGANFVTEVSMDEVDEAQSPVELFFILSAIAKEGIPAQTIAPKFTGRFNKGVDYVGDLDLFTKEFEQDLLVIDYAIKKFGLPDNLKLSVHSGSDKFSIYPIMGELIQKYDKGIHVKTAGTTWLEEVIGLAMSEGYGLELAKNIYKKAYERKDELCAPYATVIDIDDNLLPTPEEVEGWSGEKYANSLRHIPGHADYNPSLRQLIHVGYKVAAEYANIYLNTLVENEAIIAQQVIDNVYDRHIKRLFKVD